MWVCFVKEPKVRVQSRLPAGNAQAAYSLQVENPNIKTTTIEAYPSMLSSREPQS